MIAAMHGASRALVMTLVLALGSSGVSSAATTYYKHMRSASPPRRGAIVKPTFGRGWTDPALLRSSAPRDHQAGARTEALLESVRPAHAPSRLDSVFATDRPAAWKTGLAEPRFLAVLEPVNPARVATFDARHYETAYDAMFEALGTRNPLKRSKLEQRARAAATKYWTSPATSSRARPETLLGGGARFLGPAPTP